MRPRPIAIEAQKSKGVLPVAIRLNNVYGELTAERRFAVLCCKSPNNTLKPNSYGKNQIMA